MRRDQIEEQVLELIAVCDEKIARRAAVIWARSLPDAHAAAIGFTGATWIVIDEQRWADSPDERADTVAHEIAHLVSDDYSHGPRWRSRYRRLRPLAQEMEWS